MSHSRCLGFFTSTQLSNPPLTFPPHLKLRMWVEDIVEQRQCGVVVRCSIGHCPLSAASFVVAVSKESWVDELLNALRKSRQNIGPPSSSVDGQRSQATLRPLVAHPLRWISIGPTPTMHTDTDVCLPFAHSSPARIESATGSLLLLLCSKGKQVCVLVPRQVIECPSLETP
jgi:hypothetical protein